MNTAKNKRSQLFGVITAKPLFHIAKTCKSHPKCGKCANQHQTGECEDIFNSLENARVHAQKSNMTGVILVGDLNARNLHVAVRVVKCWNNSSKF